MKKKSHNIIEREFEAEIKDPKGRIVCKIKKGRIFITRSPDMSNKTKESLMELYGKMTGENVTKLKKFLNFKSKENRFCS